jgi:hypothetical protein
VAILAIALLGRLAGAASFAAYPAVKLPLGAGALVLVVALLVAVLLPFGDRRGIEP